MVWSNLSARLSPVALWKAGMALLRRMSLSVKLAILAAVVTALVVCATFFPLSFQIQTNTRRLVTAELSRNQRSLVEQQNRNLRQLLSRSSLISESPTLRAAMETFRMESNLGLSRRPELLATVQREVEKMLEDLDRDLLIITDSRGRVLAGRDRFGTDPVIGEELAGLPAVEYALGPSAAAADSSFAVVPFQGEYFQIGCVPIVLQGFPIGALILGERLERALLHRIPESFTGRVLVTTGAEVLLSMPGEAPEAAVVASLTSAVNDPTRPPVVRLAAEDYVAAPLKLGLDDSGRPVVLYLLRSVTQAVQPLHRTLVHDFLLYGSLAVLVAAVGAASLSRSVLSPLDRFVQFMRSVAETGDYTRRFDPTGSAPEIETLNDAYDHLIASLARQHEELARRTAEISQANENLRREIRDRERAEQALKEREEQLRQSQKLEALGTLAGGVAHDFNNILTVISGYAEVLLHDMPGDSRLYHDLDQIRQAAERAGDLTTQLLAFSRKQVLEPQLLDLNQIIRGLEKMLRRLIGEDIDLQTRLEKDLFRVKADPGQMEQVILNLVVNARDAMPQGGQLVIETANVTLEEGETREALPEGAAVMLAVNDTGTGMEEATRSRVFEPFFTTKPPGKGTGLGLSTVYGIVKQSGGDICVDSHPGQGTSFKIYLPRIAEGVESGGQEDSEPPPEGGPETVLLAEDEPSVRLLAEKSLRRAGYKVLAAADGVEALELAEAHEGEIHLLLTDVVMPQLGGQEVAERVVVRRPSIRVLYVSGYTGEAILARGGLVGDGQLLKKPYTPTRLLRKVREVLDAPA